MNIPDHCLLQLICFMKSIKKLPRAIKHNILCSAPVWNVAKATVGTSVNQFYMLHRLKKRNLLVCMTVKEHTAATCEIYYSTDYLHYAHSKVPFRPRVPGGTSPVSRPLHMKRLLIVFNVFISDFNALRREISFKIAVRTGQRERIAEKPKFLRVESWKEKKKRF